MILTGLSAQRVSVDLSCSDLTLPYSTRSKGPSFLLSNSDNWPDEDILFVFLLSSKPPRSAGIKWGYISLPPVDGNQG